MPRLSTSVFAVAISMTLGGTTAATANSGGTTSAERPAYDRSMQAAMDTVTREGAVGLVVRTHGTHGDWSGSSGLREEGTRRAARPQDHFRAGSITKTMVSTLVMQQVERGRWTIKTRVGDVLPGLLPGHDDVTLEQLLSHRSGIPEGLNGIIAADMGGSTSSAAFVHALSQPSTAAEFLQVALAQKWQFEPGSAFAYTNTNYIVLGLLLEELTGQSVPELLERNVFRPAGMRQTSYAVRPGLPRPTLGEWGRFPEGWLAIDQDPTKFGSAGSVVTTTADLNRFTAALASGTLLKQSLVNEMITPRSQEVGGYALGIFRVSDPCTPKGQPQQYVYGHDGMTFGSMAVALTSRDGTRRVSLGWTGRHYTDGNTQPYKIAPVITKALQHTC